MPATWTTFQPALKEVWTQEEFEAQLYDEHPVLDELEKTDKYTVGEYAIVPISTNRNGGFTVAGTAGSAALNAAGNVGLNQAQYSAVVPLPAGQGRARRDRGVAGQQQRDCWRAGHRVRGRRVEHADPDHPADLPEPVGSDHAVRRVLVGSGRSRSEHDDGYDALVRGWLDTGRRSTSARPRMRLRGCGQGHLVDLDQLGDADGHVDGEPRQRRVDVPLRLDRERPLRVDVAGDERAGQHHQPVRVARWHRRRRSLAGGVGRRDDDGPDL
jgi:hypothetical protein